MHLHQECYAISPEIIHASPREVSISMVSAILRIRIRVMAAPPGNCQNDTRLSEDTILKLSFLDSSWQTKQQYSNNASRKISSFREIKLYDTFYRQPFPSWGCGVSRRRTRNQRSTFLHYLWMCRPSESRVCKSSWLDLLWGDNNLKRFLQSLTNTIYRAVVFFCVLVNSPWDCNQQWKGKYVDKKIRF